MVAVAWVRCEEAIMEGMEGMEVDFLLEVVVECEVDLVVEVSVAVLVVEVEAVAAELVAIQPSHLVLTSIRRWDASEETAAGTSTRKEELLPLQIPMAATRVALGQQMHPSQHHSEAIDAIDLLVSCELPPLKQRGWCQCRLCSFSMKARNLGNYNFKETATRNGK